jgi:hypothetical protein
MSTLKQQAVVEKILANPSMSKRKAMLAVGYSENTATAPTKNLLSTDGWAELKEKYRQSLIEKGLDHDKLAKKMSEWIDAVKISSSLTEPDRVVPDYQTQIKAGEMLREDLGVKQEKGVQILNQGEMTLEFTE